MKQALIKTETAAVSRRETAIAKAIPAKEREQLNEAHEMFFGVMDDASLTVPEKMVLSGYAITQLREALGGKILDDIIMPLVNTALGIDTDRNPAKAYGDYAKKPYDKLVVLDCAIAAWVQGLPFVGNYWNIIGGNMYPRKEGFELLLGHQCTFVGLPDVPPISKELFASGGYLKLPVKVKYRMHGSDPAAPAKEFTGRYKVRLNKKNVVGIEATEGKAKRKAYRDLYAKLTGNLLHDGDVGDDLRDAHQVGNKSDAPEVRADDLLPAADGKREVLTVEELQHIQTLLYDKGVDKTELLNALGRTGWALEKLPRSRFKEACGILDTMGQSETRA